jgi:hypothetical protein
VSFNGTPATPTSWSATRIVAPVPNSAATGNVTVTENGQTSNGINFTVSGISVQVSPATMNLQPGQTVPVTASVQNDTQNKGVSWSLETSGCSGTDCGTLTGSTSTSVTYAAPASVPSPSTVAVMATSIADSTKSAHSTISLAPDSGTPGTPTFAGNHVSGSSTQGNAVTSYILRLPNQTQAGNCIIVGFQYSATSGVTASVSDDRGNTYSAPISHSDGNQVVNLSYALNVAPGTQTITIRFPGGAASYVSGLASEFYNVATSNAIDGSSGNGGNGTAVTAGSLSPTASGNLVYQYAVQDSTSDRMLSWTQGANPWTLLSADVFDSAVAQYQVQASAAPINPTLTMAPSQSFNSVAISLKSASAGSAPPPGIRVIRVQHMSLPPYASSPVHLQFPCTGNLIVVAWIGVANHDVTGITDGYGNSYTPTGAALGQGTSGDNQIFYAAAARTGSDMMGPNITTTGTDISGSTAVLFDVAGASSSPYDSLAGQATATGVQSSSGDVTGASITPSTAKGLVITSIGIDSNTINGVSPGNFLSALPAPISSPNPVNQNNGWALTYNLDLRTLTFLWSTQGGAVNDWATIAVAFKAP